MGDSQHTSNPTGAGAGAGAGAGVGRGPAGLFERYRNRPEYKKLVEQARPEYVERIESLPKLSPVDQAALKPCNVLQTNGLPFVLGTLTTFSTYIFAKPVIPVVRTRVLGALLTGFAASYISKATFDKECVLGESLVQDPHWQELFYLERSKRLSAAEVTLLRIRRQEEIPDFSSPPGAARRGQQNRGSGSGVDADDASSAFGLHRHPILPPPTSRVIDVASIESIPRKYHPANPSSS